MPFILPTAMLMFKMKELHYKPIHLRINFLKQLYYARVITLSSCLIVSNLL